MGPSTLRTISAPGAASADWASSSAAAPKVRRMGSTTLATPESMRARPGCESASARPRISPSSRVTARAPLVSARCCAVPDRSMVASRDAANSWTYSSGTPASRASLARSDRSSATRPSKGHGVSSVTRPSALAPCSGTLAVIRATPPMASTRAVTGPRVRPSTSVDPTAREMTPSGRASGPVISASREMASNRPRSVEPACPGATSNMTRFRAVTFASRTASSRFQEPEALNVPPGCVAVRSLTVTMRSASETSADTDSSIRPLMPMPGPETRAVTAGFSAVPVHSPETSSVPAGLHEIGHTNRELRRLLEMRGDRSTAAAVSPRQRAVQDHFVRQRVDGQGRDGDGIRIEAEAAQHVETVPGAESSVWRADVPAHARSAERPRERALEHELIRTDRVHDGWKLETHALQLRKRGVHALGVQRDGASDVGACEVASVGQHDAFDRRARESIE